MVQLLLHWFYSAKVTYILTSGGYKLIRKHIFPYTYIHLFTLSDSFYKIQSSNKMTHYRPHSSDIDRKEALKNASSHIVGFSN